MTNKVDDQSWNKVILPGRFDDIISTEFDGAIWFRKEIFIDDISHDYILSIGYVDDMDKTFINGNFIGSLSGIGVWNKERLYEIPKSYLKKEKILFQYVLLIQEVLVFLKDQ